MQLGDPSTVALVGFTARQSVHVLWVDQRQLKRLAFGPLEHVPHWHPEHTRRFHSDLLNSVFLQPISQTFQIRCEGPEQARLHLRLFALLYADACTHTLFVHIQSGTALVYQFHIALLRLRAKDAWTY